MFADAGTLQRSFLARGCTVLPRLRPFREARETMFVTEGSAMPQALLLGRERRT